MGFPKVDKGEVSEGDYLIIRYMPCFQDKGIVATRVTEVYAGGFSYQNLPMGVEGSIDDESLEEFEERGLRVDELLVGLPEGFQPPLQNEVVHSVGGVHIPKAQEGLLAQLSQGNNYQRSLKGLKTPKKVQTIKELRLVLQE